MPRSSPLVLVAVFVSALVTGCIGADSQAGRPDPEPQLLSFGLAPADGVTGVGSRVEVEAVVLVPYEVEFAQLLADLADSLQVLDPSGAPIAGQKTDVFIGYEGTDNIRGIELVVDDLGPGWHEVHFESAQTFEILARSVRAVEGGRYVSRFSTESMPSLMTVGVCSSDLVPTVVLEFTEPVRVSSGDVSSAVVISGADPAVSYACAPLVLDGNPSFDPRALTDRWELDCGDVEAPFSVSLSGISSETVALQPPTEVVVELSNIPIVDGCATWVRP